MAKSSNRSVTIRRILVAVDHSTRSDTALETAAILAKITKAHIHGLYVQEEHWENLKTKRPATYINALTGRAELLDEKYLERQVNLIASRLRRKLKALGREHEIKNSWKSIKGRVIEEILAAGNDVDLITIGKRSSSSLHKKKLGSTAKAVIQQSGIPVLVLGEHSFIGRSIIVVYGPSETSRKGLRLGLSIADKIKSRVTVLPLKNSKRDKTLEQMIGKANIPVNIMTFNQRTGENFVPIVNRQRPGLLITPKKHLLFKNASPEVLLHYLRCSILFMA